MCDQRDRAFKIADFQVKAISIMRTSECIHCNESFNGACVALGEPYHGLIHSDCLPYFDFIKNKWPHPEPAVVYLYPYSVESKQMIVRRDEPR